MNEKIYVVGHKNPDTDSVCAAIAYANLKNILTASDSYEAKRAGHTNSETKYVLRKFGVEKPLYIDTIRPRIKQVPMRTTTGIEEDTSLMRTWKKMTDEKLRTMPVFKDGKLSGIITYGEIAKSMMEETGNECLSSSGVSCKNILDTLNGELLAGDINKVFDNGLIHIGASNPATMVQHITPHSMVIMGNRADAQISALEQGAEWLIICLGSEIFDTIISLAEERGCNLIRTPYSTYEIARLINQAMPAKHVMTALPDVVSVHENDFIDDAKKKMTKRRIRYYPVLDAHENFVGFISQRNLLELDKQDIILVDHNEAEQAVDGIEGGDIKEVIDHHRVGGLRTVSPVYFRNQPLGCTCTLVAQMYRENGVEISPKMAGIMCAAIISDTLCFKSPTCTAVDEAMARELAQIAGVVPEDLAMEMFKAGSDVLDKTDEEIFYQDFKTFSMDALSVGIGQITVIGDEMSEAIEKRILPYMKDKLSNTHNDIIFFILTDIMKESSTALYVADTNKANARYIVETAFGVEAGEYKAELPGIVSRKKQIVPAITNAIQQ